MRIGGRCDVLDDDISKGKRRIGRIHDVERIERIGRSVQEEKDYEETKIMKTMMTAVCLCRCRHKQ